ncbi:MAG TPA: molybdopterin-dependent oxidoreductase [Bacteroidota bacterium]|nr:molybdopterin-dependent oxidoreductase [Bacteroidota bacterium]
MEIKRRDFIKLVGGTSVSLAVGGCAMDEVLEIPDRLIHRVRTGPGIETWKNTICGLCPGGCGISVRMVDGLPVSIRGNPHYPVNLGGMCSLGLNALHMLYHPDRLKGPMKRTANPGSGRWEPITWDEALKIIAERLTELRGGQKSRQVAVLGYDERGLMEQHIARFMKAYGSPNYFRFSPSQNDMVPHSLLHGHSRIPAYDFLNAKLIVSFGSNFLGEGYSPVYYTKLYSHHRELQTQYIQVESRMSLTAANADKWVPIRPGTYGALALGIAYVLIREELYDARFVGGSTFGFEDWADRSGSRHLGFRSIVLGNYYPEKVSEITGVPTAAILELGRLLGNTPKSLVLGDGGAVDNTNGTFAQMAVQSLNALLGNYEAEGGVFFTDQAPVRPLPDVEVDAVAAAGSRSEPLTSSRDVPFPLSDFSIESFAKNILADSPYPLSVLFLYHGNPLFQTLNHLDFAGALKKIPLVVSFDSIINETSEYAHLILPEHTFLESWGEISDVPTVGFSHFGIQQPVVEPLHDTRGTGDVFTELARRVGGTVKSAAAFTDYREEVRYAAEGLFRSGQGAVVAKGQKQPWIEFLQRRGWQTGRYATFDEFWEQLLLNGGWWNPARKKKNLDELFTTPSGKFEFFSQRLNSEFNRLLLKLDETGSSRNLESVLSRLNISARGDNAMMPHHEAVPYEGDRPMYLVTFQVMPNRDGAGAALPLMQELFGYSVHSPWESWAEIHPETAAAAGVSNDDWVWVESSIGNVRVKAKITPGIMPDVVAIPFGMGHTSYGRYARGHGVNPNTIMRNLHDLVSGKPALEATKVRISRTS